MGITERGPAGTQSRDHRWYPRTLRAGRRRAHPRRFPWRGISRDPVWQRRDGVGNRGWQWVMGLSPRAAATASPARSDGDKRRNGGHCATIRDHRCRARLGRRRRRGGSAPRVAGSHEDGAQDHRAGRGHRERRQRARARRHRGWRRAGGNRLGELLCRLLHRYEATQSDENGNSPSTRRPWAAWSLAIFSGSGSWTVVVLVPRTMATRPVRLTSRRPYGSHILMSPSTLSSSPTTWRMIELVAMSTTSARNTFAMSSSSCRLTLLQRTFTSAISRAIMSSCERSLTLTTSMSL